MSALCVIPARGGSKRIPRKNVRPFAGRPMIAWSIETARASGLFDRVVVSTDDTEIAAVARESGAEVPFLRPAELANDIAGTDAVIGHALEWFAAQGETVEEFCCIYATAPFLCAEDLRRGLELLREREAATVFSVTSFPSTIFRALEIAGDGRLRMFWPENFTRRSQDLPAAYHDAAQFYWGHTRRYLLERRLFSTNSVPVVLPRHRVQDIDTPEDWALAENLFAALRQPDRGGVAV